MTAANCIIDCIKKTLNKSGETLSHLNLQADELFQNKELEELLFLTNKLSVTLSDILENEDNSEDQEMSLALAPTFCCLVHEKLGYLGTSSFIQNHGSRRPFG